MINYVIYSDVTGEVSGWGYGTPPLDTAYLEVADAQTYAQHYVDLVSGQLLPKEAMVLGVPGATVADGLAEAVISGLPVDTYCSFSLGATPHQVMVTDGTLELSAYDAQRVQVQFWHARYQHDAVEVVFQ